MCDADGWAGSWGKNGVIVFATGYGMSLFRVSAAGGTAAPMTQFDPLSGETAELYPWFLPDGRHFLYTSHNKDPKKTAVYVADLDSKSRRRVVASDSNNVVYTPPGYLLFLREQTLMAQPFDAGKAQTTGNAVLIAEGIDTYQDYDSGARGIFSASQNGVLAYLSSGGSGGEAQLTWFDRSGKAVGTVGAPGIMLFPELSPDGSTVAIDRLDPQAGFYDLWLRDLKHGKESRFTFNSKSNTSPEWSPDGNSIVFSSDRNGVWNLYQKATSSAAPEEVLLTSAYTKQPSDWTRDGRYIIYGVADAKTKGDIWVLPLFGDRKPFPYLHTEFNEADGKVSPNGQWLAYHSDETGRNEIYVQTFPSPGGKWQISTNGGNTPAWSRDGTELFFFGADRRMMAVEVKSGSRFEASTPKPLFDLHDDLLYYSVSKDGRFLIPAGVDPPVSEPISVVVNWTAGFKKWAPSPE